MSGEPSTDLDFAAPVLSSSFSCSVVPPHRPAVCAGVWRRSPSVTDLWRCHFGSISTLHQKSPCALSIYMAGKFYADVKARAKQDYKLFSLNGDLLTQKYLKGVG